MEYPILSLKWRIILAVLFPVIIILGIVLGAAIIGLVIALFGLFALFSVFTGKKIKRPTIPRLRINLIRK